MRPWRRRGELEARLDGIEQRLADVEDTVDLSLTSDLVDELAQRVGELSVTVPTQEDLLDLRLATARVATELARVAAELHATVNRLTAATGDDVAAVATLVESLRAAVIDLTPEGSTEQRTVLHRA